MHSYSKYLNTKKRAHRKMLPQRVLLLFFVYVLLFLVRDGFGQFPSVCNTPENLQNKRCCPNDCGSASGRGSCLNVTSEAMTQANNSNATILAVLRDSASKTYKRTIDSRYLWPTMVFQNVCICNDNYYGPDCSDCNFGWTGATCSEKAPKVTRKDFRQLTNDEKNAFFHGLTMLKTETAPLYWSVITQEPRDDSGRVTLVDVTTYDYLVYIHNYVSRDASKACQNLNGGVNVDFAHSGPNFPIWHRTYMLILERAMQRVLNNCSFGFPYWSWEDDYNIFNDPKSQLGSLGSNGSNCTGIGKRMNVYGGILNNTWRTVCDITYRTIAENASRQGDSYFEVPQGGDNVDLCQKYWKPCSVTADLAQNRPLQRGNKERYLPGLLEVQMTISATRYDAPNPDYIGRKNETNHSIPDVYIYEQKTETDSFRGRLEGWSFLCSASKCITPQVSPSYQRMHNIVHDWVGGHMSVPPSAVNDPVFSLHHCNIDRILESWMKRFYDRKEPLPPYNISGGHIGHNRDDYMVPFFPLITPGQQYREASEWGYQYDNLIKNAITVGTCSSKSPTECLICKTDRTCTYYESKTGKHNPYSGVCKESCSGATKPIFNLILLVTALLFTITGFPHF